MVYEGITESTRIIEWDDVPLNERYKGEALSIYKTATREAQQIIILARTLGYTQREIGATLNVHESTISKWHHGEQEPSAENWPDLQALRESLITTGKLSLDATPRNSTQLFEDSKAKKGPKKGQAGGRERDKDRVNSNGKPLEVTNNNPTVCQQKSGDANCAKCPYKYKPKAEGTGVQQQHGVMIIGEAPGTEEA